MPLVIKLHISFLLFFICVYVCRGMHVMVHVGRSEVNLWELLLFFQHVGSGDQTWVVRLGGQHLACLGDLP